MPYASNPLRGLLVGALVGACLSAGSYGQDRLRFATPANTALQPPPATPPAYSPPYGTPSGPTATLGQGIGPFDPYSTTPGTIPNGGPPAVGGAAPYMGAPSLPPTPYPYSTPVPPATPAPGSYPTSPPVLFPQTQPLNPAAPPYYGPVAPPPGYGTAPPPYMRLIEHTGFEYTWLPKFQTGELQTQDFDFFTTITFPNFLFSPQPLKITPGFILHLWDGPAVLPGLPATAYTGYVDFGWNPRFTPQLGAELNFTPRIGTDFNTISTDSIRIAGKGAAVLWFSDAFAIKAGVDYINRADIKLLPIAGFIWKPNPQTYFDISIPSPRLSKYFSTVGTSDVWWYVGAEYGGGTWTLEYPNPVPPPPGFKSLTDINDIRIFGGFEWTSLRGVRDVKSFIEVGYVWDREIVYVSGPAFNYKPNDTLMVRAGFSL